MEVLGNKHIKTRARRGDFANSRRKMAETEALPFQPDTPSAHSAVTKTFSTGFVDLPLGPYIAEFNETVDVPLDMMGQIFVRSFLFRSATLLNAGLMDSGYKGGVGALLQVVNPNGLRL
jgi:dUTP pyrophosphatase